MCRWLQVSRSGYYEWLHRPASATARRRELLKVKIQALFDACDGSYGYRRLHAELVCGGERVGPELVRVLTRSPRPIGSTGRYAKHKRSTPAAASLEGVSASLFAP
jgi:hypothetical protein